MKLDDYIKKKGILFRISLKLGYLWLKLRIKLGFCPHDSSFGKVGAKIHYCMCGKEVENEDYELEKKFLKNERKSP